MKTLAYGIAIAILLLGGLIALTAALQERARQRRFRQWMKHDDDIYRDDL